MPDFRKGVAAMSAERQNKGPAPAFCPQIIWTEDREEKFIAFLNPAEEVARVELHQFVPVGSGTSKAGKPYTKYEQFIDRRDQAIGEDSDDLTDRLGHKASTRNIAVAVELEPTYTTVSGRKRPTGFEVKTETYTRKTDDGVEEVEAPVIGVVVQSPHNFFGWLGSFHESTAPIEETPLQVIRRGKDANTQYDFTPYLDQPIDYSNLFSFIDGVGYLRGELEGIDLNAALASNDREAALAIGGEMLIKRLNELADGERYQELVSPIEEIEDRWGGNDKPKRASQREAKPEFDDMVPPSKGTNSNKFDELRRMHEPV